MSDGSNGSGSAIPDGLVSKIEAQLVATIWLCGAKALGSAPFDPRWVHNPRVRSIVQGALDLDGDGVDYTPEQLIARVPWLVDNLDWVSKLVDESIGLSTPEDLSRNLPLLEQAWRLRQLKIAGSDLVRQPESSEVVERVKALLDRPSSGSGIYSGDFMDGFDPNVNVGDDWLIDGLIPSSAPSVIAGEPKSGKSILAAEMCICVACGFPVMGFKTKPGRVLFFPFEDPIHTTQRRLFQISRAHGVDHRSWKDDFIVTIESLAFDDPNLVAKLRQTLDYYKPVLVVIDSLSRIHSGDDSSKRDMGIVHKVWGDLAREYQTAITIIHHFAKTGQGNPRQKDQRSAGQRMRGSGDIHALVRQVVGVFGPEDDPIKTISCSGNLESKAKTFSASIAKGRDDEGYETCSWVYRGVASDARLNKVRDAIRDALVSTGGLGAKQIRESVSDLLGGVRAYLVTEGLKQLELAGLVASPDDYKIGRQKIYKWVGPAIGAQN